MDVAYIIDLLRKDDVTLTPGLSTREITEVEDRYDIHFPPDLRELLMNVLPIGKSFIPWRDTSPQRMGVIWERLNWPLEGMIFDVEQNIFWPSEWGERPTDLQEAIDTCKREFLHVPKLIPIYGHRYIPEQPCEEGNPVFSVYQTDIIVYGESLQEYFKQEFGEKTYEQIDFEAVKTVRFWSDLCS
ncbi:hypothetical protein [Paenibacillus polymyxa]|uniref:hypothetical protein n=1 Tax=Paenibacillus polymyxa TaxID=1406 RepID=UPI000589C3AB|nr:hypothetical protein [Paenibacillus polymyxa]AJE50458.1 hypothetical protein RE92_04995 [Paenibacillus polymyxa]QOH61159.1 hypothetical protein DI243_06950 [Paenibacillus polymyxa]